MVTIPKKESFFNTSFLPHCQVYVISKLHPIISCSKNQSRNGNGAVIPLVDTRGSDENDHVILSRDLIEVSFDAGAPTKQFRLTQARICAALLFPRES